MIQKVLVIIGVGGIGMAIARKEGAGKMILLADIDEKKLEESAKSLEDLGYKVHKQRVDISDNFSVISLANSASKLGKVLQVVNAAGLSPNMAAPEKILLVDLIGTAFILEEFGKIIENGGAGITISSMAGYMIPSLDQETEKALAFTPSKELNNLDILQLSNIPNSAYAYSFSKRANMIRVQAESLKWGERGGRINSISPGIIMTSLAKHEMNSNVGAVYQAMIDGSVSKRVGTIDEIATLASYLLNDTSSFMTGSDLLVDGGVIAAMKSGKISF